MAVTSHGIMKRDFLTIPDLSATELAQLLDLAARMKSGQYQDKPLAGKTLAMIFTKSSTRTRVSFEVGAQQLGGQAIFLSVPRHPARAAASRSATPRACSRATCTAS